MRGERWYAAHREHFYQKLVISGLGHGLVSSVYGILAIFSVAAGLAIAIGSDRYAVISIYFIVALTALFVIAVSVMTRVNSVRLTE